MLRKICGFVALCLIFLTALLPLSSCVGSEPDYSDPDLDVSGLSKVHQYNYYRHQQFATQVEALADQYITSLGQKGDSAAFLKIAQRLTDFGDLMQEEFASEKGAKEAGDYLKSVGKAIGLVANQTKNQDLATTFLNQVDLAGDLLEQMPKDATQTATVALECADWVQSPKPHQLAAVLAMPQKESDPDKMVITLGGNTFLGNEENSWSDGFNLAAANSDLGDYYPFLYCLPYFLTDDLTLVTYEGNFTKQPAAKPNAYNGFDSYATAMGKSGIDVVSLATDRGEDHYSQGRQDTADTLKKAGIESFSDQGALYFESKLGRVAFLSFDCVSATPNVDMILQQDIAKANAKGAKIIIVAFHWGKWNSDSILPHQLEYGRKAAAYGADLVLGSHPYLLQGIEYTNLGRGIFYSLGNLCHGADREHEYPDTALVQVTVTRKGGKYTFTDYKVIPMTRSARKGEAFMPTPALGSDYARIEKAILNGPTKLKDSIQSLN